MKKLCLIMLLLLPAIAWAQPASNTARRMIGGTLPATCSAGPPVDVWVNTAVSPPVVNVCGPANTWNALSNASGAVTTAATLTSGKCVIGNGSATITIDSSCSLDGSGNLTATSFTSSTANGGADFTEGTGAALTAAASHDLLWGDSTAHRLKTNPNNGTAGVIVDTGNANTALTGMTLDMSAATGATALKVPVQAGCTAGADGVVCYDSTNKNTHIRSNGADTLAVAETAAVVNNTVLKSGSSSLSQAVASSTIDDGSTISSTEVAKYGNTVLLTADATGITATTPGTVIFTMGTMKASTNYSLHCEGTYSQATGAAANGVAIQGATNAPTRIDASYNVWTSNAGVNANGNLANLTTTTLTALSGTFTPSATATIFNWEVRAVVQNGATATSLKVAFFTGNASDALTIKAGSYCTLLP